MKSVAANRSLKLHRQKLAVATALFVGVMFWVLVVSTVVVVKTTGSSKSYAAGGASATVDWSSNKASFRYTVCLAGTSQCQASFKTTTNNDGLWQLASLAKYDVHIDISANGSNWYGWENLNNVSINCGTWPSCNKTFTWTKVGYVVRTNLDNTDHIVVQPSTSYTYSNVAPNTNFSGTISFNDFGGLGTSRLLKNVSGTTSGYSFALGNPTISGNTANFSISSAAGVGSILYIKDLATSIPIPTGVTSIAWTGAAGAHSAVISAYGVDVSNTVAFTLNATPNWILAAPTFNNSNGDVTFNFSPASNGNIGLVVKNKATNTVAYDSGAIPNGVSTKVWSNGPNGNYEAVLVYATTSVSNVANFTLNRPISAPSCNITATSVVSGQSLTVVHGGFSAGASIRLFGVPGQFDTNTKTLDSKSALVSQNVVIPATANEGEGYSIVIVTSDNTLYTCTGGPLRVIVVTCSESDIDGDGSVTILDITRIQGIVGSRVGNVKYNGAYDFNQDGAISIADAMLAAQFFGQNCGTKPPPPPPVSCAIKSTSVVAGQSLVVTYSGFASGESIRIFGATRQFNTNAVTSNSTNTIVSQNVIIPTGVVAGSGYNIVVVTKSNLLVNCSGGPISIIVLTCTMADVDRDGSVTSLDFAKISALVGVKAGGANYNPFYDLNKDGAITRADVLLAGTFFGQKCPQATPILLPVTYPTSATLCTDSPYEATLKWQNKGPGWFVDVSDDFEFKHYWNKKVDNLTSTVALTGFKGASTNPAMQPGVRYWWRVWNTETNVSSSFELSIIRDWCHPPFDSTYPSGWPTENGEISQGPNTTYTHNDDNAESIDDTRPIGALVKATLDGTISIICKDKALGQPLECTGLGNAIVLKSHNFTVTYAHFSGFGPTISLDNPIGQKIRFGDVIGYAGCTGTCTGSHVHYQFNGLKMAFTNSDNSYHYIPLPVPQGCLSESSCKVSW